jgi:hypothetical protein
LLLFSSDSLVIVFVSDVVIAEADQVSSFPGEIFNQTPEIGDAYIE